MITPVSMNTTTSLRTILGERQFLNKEIPVIIYLPPQ
jgi:hypothetical protein